MMADTTFGTWMRTQRRSRDWTQEQVAGLIGCSTDLIIRLEGNTRRPSRALVERIFQVLAVPADLRPALMALARGVAPAPDSAPTPAMPVTRPPLPALRTVLIGRDHDLEALERMLQTRRVRLLSLVGPPGVGKTTLALALGHRIGAQFPDGAAFIPLDQLSHSAEIPAALARVLLPDVTSVTDGVPQIIAHLQHQARVLIMDNCEHLLDGIEIVGTLLDAVPQLTIIATSREPLRLYGEYDYPVHPLAVPVHGMDALQIRENPAVQLFLALPSWNGGYHTDDELALIARICTAVDGLPLAVELAAAACRHHRLEDVAAQLQTSLPPTQRLLRDRPARQQTMEGALAWSIAALVADQRRVMLALSWFPAGAALPRLARSLAQPDESVSALLVELEEKQLVIGAREEGSRRWRQLHVVRIYVQSGAIVDAEGEEIAARVVDEAIDFLVELEGLYGAPGMLRRALARYDSEAPNVLQALVWSIAHDVARAARIILLLEWVWRYRDRPPLLAPWVRHIYAAAAALPAVLHGRVLRYYAMQYAPRQEQLPLLQESSMLGGTHNDIEGCAESATALAGVYFNSGDWAQAEQYFRESLEHFRTLGNRHRELQTLGNLAATAAAQGALTPAERLLGEGIVLATHLNNPWTAASFQTQRAYLLAATGAYQDAQHALDRSYPYLDEVQDQDGLINWQYVQAWVYFHRGEVQRAWHAAQASWDHWMKSSQHSSWEDGLDLLAALKLADRAYGAAAQILSYSDTWRQLNTLPRDPILAAWSESTREGLQAWGQHLPIGRPCSPDAIREVVEMALRRDDAVHIDRTSSM